MPPISSQVDSNTLCPCLLTGQGRGHGIGLQTASGLSKCGHFIYIDTELDHNIFSFFQAIMQLLSLILKGLCIPAL